MAPQNIPVNQLDALPLLTVQDATSGGEISIVGGAISRTFTPTVLGINGNAPLTNTDGIYYLATPYLDLRGTRFMLMHVRYTASAAINPGGFHWYAQHRMGPSEAPGIPANFGNSIYDGTWRDPSGAPGYVMPAFAGPGSTADILLGWDYTYLVGDGTANREAIGGQNMRFILTFGNVANTNTRLTFIAWIEASS